mgnify:CR=1 FL=1
MGYRDTSKTAEQITSIAKHHGFFFVRAGVTANSCAVSLIGLAAFVKALLMQGRTRQTTISVAENRPPNKERAPDRNPTPPWGIYGKIGRLPEIKLPNRTTLILKYMAAPIAIGITPIS